MPAMNQSESLHRWRITFSVSGPIIYYSVLDMGRMWERLLRRAGLPIAYTQGYHPHPRMQFAAALPVGYSSECEMVDLYLGGDVGEQDLLDRVVGQCPRGLSALGVENVPLKAKLPQSMMREAHYRVVVQADGEPDTIQNAIETLLARETILRQRRGKQNRSVEYDLRALVYDIRLSESAGPRHTLEMTVKCGSHGAGRPEEIIAELELPVSGYTIHRERLVWGDIEEGAS